MSDARNRHHPRPAGWSGVRAGAGCLLPMVLVLAVSTQWPGAAHAGTPGSESGAFAPIDAGARALGMGGAVRAVGDGAWATLWNPANLFDLDAPELAVDYADLFGLGIARHTSVAFAWRGRPMRNVIRDGRLVEVPREQGILAWGLSLGVTSVDLEPESYTEVTPALSVAGRPWHATTVGGTLRILRASSDLDEVSALGYALDLGLTTRQLPWATAALTIQNLLSTVSWSDQISDTLPVEVTLAIASRRLRPVLLAAELSGSTDNAPLRVARFGGEWSHVSGQLALRAGGIWHEDRGDDAFDATFGASAGLAGISADYAFVGHNDVLGDTHRFSLRMRF